MTVYTGSVAFVAQLQRERDEALAENTKLRAELARLRGLSNKLTEATVPRMDWDEWRTILLQNYAASGTP